jgi:hypothetical protein
MYELYGNSITTYIGYENNKTFVNESLKRRHMLGYNDIQIYNEDIFNLTSESFGKFDYVICYSFDPLFPPKLVEHIRDNIIKPYNGNITWTTCMNDTNLILMKNKFFIGKPGVNENDQGIILSDGLAIVDEDSKIVKLKNYL